VNAHKWEDLLALSDSDLVKEHDQRAGATVVGINYYLDELRHRRMEKHSRIILRYTREIKWLTIIVTLATLVNLGVALFL